MGENRYVTKRSFDVYEGVANNQSGIAGAFVAGGIGLGAASDMRNSMHQTVENPLNREDKKICVSCGVSIPVNSKFCPECGANNSTFTCECGTVLSPGTKFCPECGKKQ